MNQKEFEQWQAVTASSRHRWVEDVIFRLNGRGAMYYIGGEDGTYMKITNDGVLELGTYEGAVPHIGEAMFTTKATRQCAGFDEAFQLACQLGGKKLLADMFSNDQLPQEMADTQAQQQEPGPIMKM